MAKDAITKFEIIFHFAEEFEFSKKMSSAIPDDLLTLTISKTPKRDHSLPGTIILPSKPTLRTDCNPTTGAEIKSPAKK
jgi:hypothetical protein